MAMFPNPPSWVLLSSKKEEPCRWLCLVCTVVIYNGSSLHLLDFVVFLVTSASVTMGDPSSVKNMHFFTILFQQWNTTNQLRDTQTQPMSHTACPNFWRCLGSRTRPDHKRRNRAILHVSNIARA